MSWARIQYSEESSKIAEFTIQKKKIPEFRKTTDKIIWTTRVESVTIIGWVASHFSVLTGGHYVFGQNSNHCSWTLWSHIDMKSGMHDQCSFLFLGAEVHHYRSAVPVRSTRALPGPFNHCSRHLLLKENFDNAVLVARLLIRVDFPFS